MKKKSKSVAVIVAHPDDETLWAGGTILSHPSWKVLIVSLSRASDENRAPNFFEAVKALHAKGKMGDLEDNSEQKPLNEKEIQGAIMKILPKKHFDLIITHNPSGEYTRHIRHEEVSKAVIDLWHSGKISANKLWTFAYEDGGKEYYPIPIEVATSYRKLPKKIWKKKYNIITKIYGFDKGGFEAETTPKGESFWKFKSSETAIHWLTNKGKL